MSKFYPELKFLLIPPTIALLYFSWASPIKSVTGWLGNPVTHAIVPSDRYVGDPLEAVWLPNKATAHKWQKYVTKGRIFPTRKPATPTNVRATTIGAAETKATWSFTSSLEGRLPSFHIYCDQSLVVTFQGQMHNCSDAPKTPNIVLEFIDKYLIPIPFEDAYNQNPL